MLRAAEAFRLGGRLGRARDLLDRAFEVAERLDVASYEGRMCTIQAEVLLDAGDHEQAEPLLLRAVEAARSTGLLLDELRASIILARLSAGTGKQAEARARLASVYERVTEGFDTKRIRDAKALLEELA